MLGLTFGRSNFDNSYLSWNSFERLKVGLIIPLRRLEWGGNLLKKGLDCGPLVSTLCGRVSESWFSGLREFFGQLKELLCFFATKTKFEEKKLNARLYPFHALCVKTCTYSRLEMT